MSKSFYITTPIYYPSDKLHIGHSYTTVAADTMARYKRLRGYDVMFLTGTDEHGQKIQEKALEAGKTPQEFVDNIVAGIKDLWKLLDISYDHFIRTTDKEHEQSIQAIFQKLYDKGDIYLGSYEGWYCTPDESFWTETQLVDGNCPDCGRPVEYTSEPAYFFRISKYQDALIKLLEENPDFVQPQSRANEMLNNFLRPGLEDLCVSRTSFDWGVKVPFDPRHVVYVWIDALSNYITALGYPDMNGDMARYWPADVQLVGKEIVRFHTIIWPAMLMALDLPLPKQVFAHGWLLFREGKMSKSKGNVIDPVKLCDKYGVDSIRYFLLREVPFGSDGNFSNEALITRINADLANDLGNLVSRTVAMIDKYFPEGLPTERLAAEADKDLLEMLAGLPDLVENSLDQLQFSTALSDIWRVVGRSNKYIDETAPWLLAKNEDAKPRLAMVLYNLAESIRVISILISPFMPRTPELIRKALGISDASATTWEAARRYGLFAADRPVQKGEPLFPRIDIVKEIAALDAELEAEAAAQAETEKNQKPTGGDKSADGEKKKNEEKRIEATSIAEAEICKPATEEKVQADFEAEQATEVALIEYDDFAKLQLLVGTIKNCEKVKGADRLLVSQIDIGTEIRTVVSGIASSYDPEDLIGKQVVLVANLKPRKIRGILSHGMILSASSEEGFNIVTIDSQVAPGSEVS